jgi:acyl CoA:acetate/3-ketoacid CoA transferase beta subunit
MNLDNYGKIWSDEDNKKLSELYLYKTDNELAIIFKRTKVAIQRQKSVLNLVKITNKSNIRFSKKDDKLILDLFNKGKTIEDISKLTNRTFKQVKNRITFLK